MKSLKKIIKNTTILVSVGIFTACGANDDDTTTSTDTSSEVTTWAQASALIDTNCSTSGCHGTSKPDSTPGSTVYQGKQEIFENAAPSGVEDMSSKGVSPEVISSLTTYLKSVQ